MLRESEAGNTEGAGWDSVVETLRLYARGSLERLPTQEGDELGLSLEDSINVNNYDPNLPQPPPIPSHVSEPLNEESRGVSSGAFKVLRSLSRGMLLMGSSTPNQEKKVSPRSSPAALTVTTNLDDPKPPPKIASNTSNHLSPSATNPQRPSPLMPNRPSEKQVSGIESVSDELRKRVKDSTLLALLLPYMKPLLPTWKLF